MDYLQYIPRLMYMTSGRFEVLNLVINGLPSILTFEAFKLVLICVGFKPCYKWITFNTLTEGIDAVFMVERSHFYMVAKTIHFSVF